MTFLSAYLKKTFGSKVYRVSLSTGCTCPNRDGKLSFGGCTFCSEGGSGEFAQAGSFAQQFEKGKKLIESKLPKNDSSQKKYIAYFQSFSNTYVSEKSGPSFEELEKIFLEAANHREVAVISIGTRPHCIDEKMLNLISRLNKIKPVWIELGLQTADDKTGCLINRNFSWKDFTETYARLKSRGISVIVHVIFGLPGETEETMLLTVKKLGQLTPVLDGIKIHNLQILSGTKISEDFKNNPWHVMTLEEYSELLKKALALLNPATIIHRITGDGPKKLLMEPKWSSNKKMVLNHMKKLFPEMEK